MMQVLLVQNQHGVAKDYYNAKHLEQAHFQAYYTNQPGLEECMRDLFELDELVLVSVVNV